MIIKNILAGALLLAVAACAEAPSDKINSFDTLIKDHWNNVLTEQVFFRRDPDVYRMDGHLANFSKSARDRRQAFNETVLSRLAAIDEKSLSTDIRLIISCLNMSARLNAKAIISPIICFR